MASLAYKRKYAQSTLIMLQHSRIVCVHVVVAAKEQRIKVCDVLFVSITSQFCKLQAACAIAVGVHVVKRTGGCTMSLILLGCP